MASSLIEDLKALKVVERRDKMVTHAMNKIRPILRRMENMSLLWVTNSDLANYSGFVLPLQPLLRREVRDFCHLAYLAGASDQARVLDKVLSSRDSDVVRIKADLVVDKIVSDTEHKLKLGWASYGRDPRYLKYHTSKVFAELAERTLPNGL
jgi:hypothetical protein